MWASKWGLLSSGRRVLTSSPVVSTFRAISNVNDPIVLTDDGSTFVAWHPAKSVPYEFTRPMPKAVAKPPQVLRTDDYSAVSKPQKEHEVIQELSRITYTTKHRWYPQGNRFKRKRENEKKFYHKQDREYL